MASHLSFFNGSREDCNTKQIYQSNVKFSLVIRKHVGLFIAIFLYFVSVLL